MRLSSTPLIDREPIAHRIHAMARQLDADYAQREPVLLGVLKGAMHFVSDLARALPGPVEIDFVRAASYAGAESTGIVSLELPISIPLQDRHVIVVEDILDTGRTASTILAHLKALRPASLAMCTLLDKPSRRVIPVTADYVGFTIEDHFVVGYGLDYNERYRELPAIHILEPD